jgi:hypothetical protein
MTSKERIEANREQMLKWEREGRSYFWTAMQIGLNDRNAGAVSKWFVAQGIHRKATK